jgi:flagellar biogenesis protein FliO
LKGSTGSWGQLSEIGKVGGALALVIALIFLTKKAVGGKLLLGGAGARPSGVLEILARFPLGKGQQLIVLKIARRVLLVSQGPQGSSTLAEFTDRDEVANLLSRMEAGATGNSIKRFRNVLQGFSNDELNGSMTGRERAGDGDATVVDLTRSQGGALAKLFHRGGG